MERKMQAGQFKAQCLKVMDQVQKNKISVTITKHHKPVAKLVPIQEKKRPIFGWMKGSVEVLDDIIEPINVEWDVCS